MRSFYQYLQSGLSKEQTLRQAKRTYLENRPTQASPFFWALPVLHGSPQPVPMGSSGRFFVAPESLRGRPPTRTRGRNTLRVLPL